MIEICLFSIFANVEVARETLHKVWHDSEIELSRDTLERHLFLGGKEHAEFIPDVC